MMMFRRWAHPLQEQNDCLLSVWLHSGQLVEPELKLSPGVFKHPTVLKHLNTRQEVQPSLFFVFLLTLSFSNTIGRIFKAYKKNVCSKTLTKMHLRMLFSLYYSNLINM